LTDAGSDEEDTRKKALVITIPLVSVITILLLVVFLYIYMGKRKHKGKFLINLNYVCHMKIDVKVYLFFSLNYYLTP